MGENRQTLKRIVMLLLSLADLAERASARSRTVLALVLCILRPAEAIARRFVVEAWPARFASPCFDDPASHAADARVEALRLAAAFRLLAAVLAGLVAAGAPSCSLPLARRRHGHVAAATRSPVRQARQYADTS